MELKWTHKECVWATGLFMIVYDFLSLKTRGEKTGVLDLDTLFIGQVEYAYWAFIKY